MFSKLNKFAREARRSFTMTARLGSIAEIVRLLASLLLLSVDANNM